MLLLLTSRWQFWTTWDLFATGSNKFPLQLCNSPNWARFLALPLRSHAFTCRGRGQPTWAGNGQEEVRRNRPAAPCAFPARTLCFHHEPWALSVSPGRALPHWNVFCFGAWRDRRHLRKPCCNLRAHRRTAFLQCGISSAFSSFLVSSRPLCNLQTEDNR